MMQTLAKKFLEIIFSGNEAAATKPSIYREQYRKCAIDGKASINKGNFSFPKTCTQKSSEVRSIDEGVVYRG